MGNTLIQRNISLQEEARTDCIGNETLRKLDDLHAHYHKKWWCYQQAYRRFKMKNAVLTLLSLLCIALGVIVGSVYKESVVVVTLASLGTVLKGVSDFKKFPLKCDMCKFAYSSNAKVLMELRACAQGLPFDVTFLTRMEVLEEIIVDFTPPLEANLLKRYDSMFHLTHDDAVSRSVPI